MDPLTIAAIALGIVATKTLEKTTENVTDAVWTRSQAFIAALKKQSPDTVTAIAKAPEQPLDYGEAILEVEAAVSRDPGVKAAMEALINEARSQPFPQLDNTLKEMAATLERSAIASRIDIEKVANFAQRDTVYNIKGDYNLNF